MKVREPPKEATFSAWLDRRLRAHVDADAAADVVQETCIRAVPCAVRHPKAFLLKIALDPVRDESRKQVRRRRDRSLSDRPTQTKAAPRKVSRGCDIINLVNQCFRATFGSDLKRFRTP
jgi:DNA-directed RNA polymerase specialized sigma24 family protein